MPPTAPPAGCAVRPPGTSCPADRPISVTRTAAGFADDGKTWQGIPIPPESASWCCDGAAHVADVVRYDALPRDDMPFVGPVRVGTRVTVEVDSRQRPYPYVFDPATGRTTFAPVLE
jgi:hypothetical protein